jgi:uncharacterized protein YbjT (DUF2867 family)
MILVVGATGHLGGDICRRLAERGEPVRGLVRASSDRDAVDRLRALGVELVAGDLRDRASLEAACQGVRGVVSTATTVRSRQPGDSIEVTDEAGQCSFVDAACAAGVEQFVYVSYSANIDGDDPLTHAKRRVERAVRESGMRYTILRPSYFMEMWLGPALSFDYVGRRATVYGSGEQRISFISRADVAEFAVLTLANTRTDLGAEPRTLELGGPEPVSPREAVRIFEEAMGAPFEVQYVPEAVLRAQRDAATESLQRAFASLMLAYANGDAIPMEETRRQYPVALTSVRDYAWQVAGRGGPTGARTRTE